MREITSDLFKTTIYTILTDVFIDRKYRSPERIKTTLQLDSEEVANNIFWIVRSLINNLYEQNASYDELTEFMVTKLEFTEEKANTFIQLIFENKDKLENYFIFEQIQFLRKTIDEISTTKETE